MRNSMMRILVLAAMMAGATTAKAQTQLQLISNGQTLTFASSTSSASLLDGWSVTSTSGTAVPSPGAGINLSSFRVSCVTSACESHPLDIIFSGSGFTETSLGFDATYVVAGETGGSTTGTAWYSTSNTLGAETTLIGGPLTFSGAVLFGSEYTSGGPPASGPYSLTVDDEFNASPGGATFTVANSNISEMPEPRSMLLFGTGLLVFAGILRRRLRA
jgi:hypothetical protein